MLYDDQPISQDEEDKLNRTPFVDEIVELINRYTEYDEKKDKIGRASCRERVSLDV